MSKKTAAKRVLPLSLLLLVAASVAAPAARMHAESVSTSVVSGGDPEPTGEPDVATIVLAVLLAMPVS